MMTDRPKERDLFSVKGRDPERKKKKGIKRKINKTDILEQKVKRRKEEEEDSETEPLVKHVPLSYQHIPVGQVVLGCVFKVLRYGMIVSLPNRMQGDLPMMNISKSYNNLVDKISTSDESCNTFYNLKDLYSVGHLIVTQIKSVVPYNNETSKITLSILPEDVNKELTTTTLCLNSVVQSEVVSEEENGFIMDTGIRNLRAAFLAKEYAPKGTVGVGSVFLCGVRKIFDSANNKREMSISLTAEPSVLNKPFTMSDQLNVFSLMPGTRVSAKVEKKTQEGLEISINDFKGFVTTNHLKSHKVKKQSYKIGRSVEARVLYVQDLTSEIYCTLNSKMCSKRALKKQLNDFSIGDVCEATVSKVTKEGIHFILANDCQGYYSKDKDELPKKGLLKQLVAGSSVTTYVKHIHLMDQLYILSIRNEGSLERGNLFVGKLVSVQIAKHKKSGAIGVISGTGIVGFIPKRHFPCSTTNKPDDEICRVGKKYSARILRYSFGNELQLTLKTDLINCDLPLVTDFSESFVGIVTMGCIVRLVKRAFFVEFFKGVIAYISISKVPKHLRDDFKNNFSIGLVIKCKIISFNAAKKKLIASLLLDSAVEKIDSQLNSVTENSDLVVKQIDSQLNSVTENSDLVVKQIDSQLNSVSKNSDIVVKQIDRQLNSVKENSYFVVKHCKVSYIQDEKIYVHVSGSGDKASIPLYHLSDDIELARIIFALLKIGDEIQNAVVFQSSFKLTLSLKPSVYRYLKNIKKKDQIKCGCIFPSVITKIFDNKICVITSEMKAEKYIKNNSLFEKVIHTVSNMGIEYGQTLMIKCVEVRDKVPLQFVSDLKSVMYNCRTSSLQLLYDTLVTESQIRKALSTMNKVNLGKLEIGSSYTGKVLFISKAGAFVRIPQLGLDGAIHPNHYDISGVPKLYKTLPVRILGTNFKEKCLELTGKHDLNFFSISDHNVKVGQECTCEILVAKKEYIVARLETLCEGQIVYLPSRRHINDLKGRYSFYETGHKYEIVIEYVNQSFILANLKVHTNMELLDIEEQCPNITFNGLDSSNSLGNLMLDKTALSTKDFINKAKKKIENVTKFSMKKNKNENQSTKWETLQDDNFVQYDDQLYCESIIQKRQDRKLKKQQSSQINIKRANFEKGTNDMYTDSELQDTLSNKSSEKRKANVKEMKEKTNVKKKKIAETPDKTGDVISPRREVDEENEDQFSSKHSTKILKKNEGKETTGSGEPSVNFLEIKSTGFDWSGQICSQESVDEESSSEEEEENDKKEQKSVKRLNKYEKSSKLKAEERKTRELELERLDQDREPETAMDFEEKVERNPHSSTGWIEYISFHLENAETDKARAVAERGLNTVPATKTEERLALWNVALRLEVMYGTPETLQKSFSEAVALNDELRIYYIMIDIYFNANKVKEAEELMRKMIKKYSQNRDVWIKAFTVCFKANESKEARTMLDKSLLSLPKNDHVEIINRFAQLELKYGDVERGKTIFEKLLNNFPKRLDIWNVYSDLLLKQNDIEGARNVLERITGLKLKMAAMRNAFKKLLEFEKKHGTPLRVEAVKTMVEEYVSAALKDDE